MVKAAKENKDEPLEKQLWKAADKLRKNIDAAEYKHVVMGLIFLKYISDSFEEMFARLQAGVGEYAGADPEDKDEYKAENVFFVPSEARWSFLVAKAKLPTIGTVVDEAMDAIEKENPSLKGVLPKVFARQNLDPASLGGLIDLVGNIALGDAKSRSADVLGHVFEYFLGEFALAEGKQGGQFYTPRSIVELLVAMLEPYKGRVFDPCCGSGGMFVQSEKFVAEHQGRVNDISIYGQESNQTTWRLAKMNLAIRGIDSSQVKWNNEGSFLNDAHKDLKADFIIAKPLITSKHILDGRLDIANAYLISEDDYNQINQRSKVDTGDILFSMIGTIGLIYLEQSPKIDYAIKNIGLFKTSQNPDWALYTYLWLRSSNGRQFIDEHKSGSTQEYVSLGSLRSIVFLKPPIDVLHSFNKLASGYFSKMILNRSQIQTLEKLRDNLLPKLMSGEVRVAA